MVCCYPGVACILHSRVLGAVIKENVGEAGVWGRVVVQGSLRSLHNECGQREAIEVQSKGGCRRGSISGGSL